MTASAREPLGRRASEQRKAAVLHAAEALFISKGVDKTSIETIALQAGVAKGTVYLYFPSKEHIVSELEKQFEQRIVSRVQSAASDHHDPGKAVAAWAAGLVYAYLDELELHDMLFYGRRRTSTRADVADNCLIDDLTALLSQLGTPAPNELAAFIVGGVTLLVDRAVLAQQPVDRGSLATSARHLAQSAARTSGRADERTSGRADERTSGRADERTS